MTLSERNLKRATLRLTRREDHPGGKGRSGERWYVRIPIPKDIYERDKALLVDLIDQLIIQTSRPAGQL